MRTLSNALREYVAVRRALGTQLQEPAMTLGHFVEFLEPFGKQSLNDAGGSGMQYCPLFFQEGTVYHVLHQSVFEHVFYFIICR